MKFRDWLKEGKNFKKGDKLKISSHISEKGKGLSYGNFEAEALEDGGKGGWDVYDVKNLKTGKEESVYGFSVK